MEEEEDDIGRREKEREAKDAAGQKPTPGDQLCRLPKQATDHRKLNRAPKGSQAKDCRTLTVGNGYAHLGLFV